MYFLSIILFLLPIQRNLMGEVILFSTLVLILAYTMLLLVRVNIYLVFSFAFFVVALVLNSTYDVYRVGIDARIIVAILIPILFSYLGVISIFPTIYKR